MIIAESCCNWHDLDEAKQMIGVARGCGAGLVKFQLYDADDDRGKPHYDWVKAHELTFDQAKELFDYGASIGQEVFFSVFGVKYVEWCEKIGVKRYKIGAGNWRDRRTLYLQCVETGKKVILSRPGWGFGYWNTTIVLRCPQGYPQTSTSIKGDSFEREMGSADYYAPGTINGWEPAKGWSDHWVGLDAAKIALARGAQIIEKHFCLEHDKAFPDDAWSMTPEELRELVRWEKVCQEVIGAYMPFNRGAPR